ncbi:Fe-S cluster assembly protein SufD [Methylovirgula sp. 4M-Z18]|uniref:Fe-S cluster assembly protein SufD n=1 Tax=Methylovirgula sp. 4M-Z18 TaxID=2293567 RepID=UPI000E2E496D|nr:Fe-S cluster assembly protein SufD [Methylovirgula sp. 4M-Z18]RFB80787.1 Fe-S cluster assembly protein SufD [Methylovirgula sp. 4M-Z18]
MSAQIHVMKTPAETALSAEYARVKTSLPGDESVAKLRDAAFGQFEKAGLPHRRVEAWHYTDLRSMLRDVMPVSAAPLNAYVASLAKHPAFTKKAHDDIRLFLVDGVFAPEISDLASLPKGVLVRAQQGWKLAAGDLGANDSVVALNTAFMQGGVEVVVEDGAQIAAPLHIITILSDGARQSTFSRSSVSVGKGARVTIIENHHASRASAHQLNAAMSFQIGDNAEVEHVCRLAHDNVDAVDLTSLFVEVGAHASFDTFGFVDAGGLIRRQFFLRFAGEHSKAAIRGVGLLNGKQHVDTTLVVDHVAPHCESRELFRHIVDEEATGVFQGKIIVRPGAQKTDGVMKSQALLLSEASIMNNKPELEIFADDVICGHGATVGQLDEDQLFYLMARGLPKPEAEALLLEAFADEVIEMIAHEPSQEDLKRQVKLWLGARARAE